MRQALVYTLGMAMVVFTTSCKSNQPVVIEKTITETVTEVKHDTIFETHVDSSSYRALLECQNGKPQIKEVISKTSGKHNLKKPKVSIDNKGLLSVDCETYVEQFKAEWISLNKSRTEKIEVPVYINTPLTNWQIVQLWMGRVFMLLLLGLLIGYLSKKYFKK